MARTPYNDPDAEAQFEATNVRATSNSAINAPNLDRDFQTTKNSKGYMYDPQSNKWDLQAENASYKGYRK